MADPKFDPLLDGLDAETRDVIEKQFNSRITSFNKDQIICRDGDPADRMWLILSGTVSVHKGGQVITERHANEIVGEQGVIDSSRERTADMIAKGKVYLLEITFDWLNYAESKIIMTVYRNLAKILSNKLHQATESRYNLSSEVSDLDNDLNNFTNSDARAFARHVREKRGDHVLKRCAVVIFTDLKGFTKLSETIPRIEESSQIVFRAMNAQSKCIKKHMGIIDKFMGDAMMAYWIVEWPNREDQATKKICVSRAVTAVIEAVNSVRSISYNDLSLDLRVGINIGEVIQGNFGSDDLWDFTLIGDAVNFASRLEGAKPNDPDADPFGPIRISQEIYALLDDTHKPLFSEVVQAETKDGTPKLHHLICDPATALAQT